jgi:hypothetical protein
VNDITTIIRLAEKAGCIVTTSKGGHLRFQLPNGSLVFGPKTPNGGCRSIDNLRAKLKREGVPV